MEAFLEQFINNKYIDYEHLSDEIMERLSNMTEDELKTTLEEGWMLNDLLSEVIPGDDIVVSNLKLNICWNEYIDNNDFVNRFRDAYMTEITNDSSDDELCEEESDYDNDDPEVDLKDFCSVM